MSGSPTRGGTAVNGKPSYTSEQAAAALSRSGARWSADADGSATVSYGFRASGSVPIDGGGEFSPFGQAQIAATELALQAWSDVANIRFVRSGSGGALSSEATILFGAYTPSGEHEGAAFAHMPGNRAFTSRAGDIWVNNEFAYNRVPVTGDYGQQVLAHEIGHAIGLSHPSDYDASDETDPTYAASAVYYEDARQYSIMSYFASSNTGATLGAFASAPQIDDVAAIQRLYGMNRGTRAGDTVYGFNSSADRPWYSAATPQTAVVFAVWDGGGRDTLDFSGYGQNQTIDLRQGAFSDVGGWVNNVSIAFGAVIEEAVGGGGADVLVANDDHGALLGGLGADRLVGGLGNDHLYGAGRLGVAGDGADVLLGGDGHDYLQGNAGGDNLSGGNGEDRISGGQDGDVIDGGSGHDSVNGNVGDDRIAGGTGNDHLRGGQGNDQLAGDEGNDLLSGDLGDDRLDGGAGLDVLSGGAGADVFRLGGTAPMLSGEFAGLTDMILDFEDGVDRLSLGSGGRPDLLYGRFEASAALADMVAYARHALGDTFATAAVAVGYGADTLLFSRESIVAELDAVRLAGVLDPQQITAADFA